jgi:hypothetical protein
MRSRQQRIAKCNQIGSAGDYFETRRTTRRPCGESAHLVVLHAGNAISVTKLSTNGGKEEDGALQ